MKRANVVLDEALVGKAMRLTGFRSQRALIDHALRDLIRRKEQKRILRWRGKVLWKGEMGELRTNRF